MTLEVRDLVTSFRTPAGLVRAVDGVSFDLEDGRTLCIAGESGCGKSVTALSIMGLLPDNAVVESGAVRFRGRDLVAMAERERMQLRGKAIGMIFQEPMTALNPVLTVGEQVAEVFLIHRSASRAEAHRRALAMLEKVQIPDAQHRFGEYPHQMSGGMKQRVMIAMALAHGPDVLLADEPTTALDVTIQAQVLRLLRELQQELGTAIVFVTHDLAVVAEIADAVVVMYAGRVVERADAVTLFERAAHPYTRGVRAARPRRGRTPHDGPLHVIPGRVPQPHERQPGCSYANRCDRAQSRCRDAAPLLQALPRTGDAVAHDVACFYPVVHE
jgi:oligopeptide/dipeptide ABC transporter ATP-binding protein